MTTTTTPRREATRLRLIEAGLHEFSRRGVDATSVEQVCEAAGFTRGAFYSNFSSKDDLCVAIVHHLASKQLASFERATEAMPKALDAAEAVQHVLAARLDLTAEKMNLMLELRLRARRDPQFAARLSEAQEQLLPLFVRLLSLAAERADVELLVDPVDLLNILDALYALPPGPDEQAESARLMALVAQHLTRPGRNRDRAD